MCWLCLDWCVCVCVCVCAVVLHICFEAVLQGVWVVPCHSLICIFVRFSAMNPICYGPSGVDCARVVLSLPGMLGSEGVLGRA